MSSTPANSGRCGFGLGPNLMDVGRALLKPARIWTSLATFGSVVEMGPKNSDEIGPHWASKSCQVGPKSAGVGARLRPKSALFGPILEKAGLHPQTQPAPQDGHKEENGGEP